MHRCKAAYKQVACWNQFAGEAVLVDGTGIHLEQCVAECAHLTELGYGERRACVRTEHTPVQRDVQLDDVGASGQRRKRRKRAT